MFVVAPQVIEVAHKGEIRHLHLQDDGRVTVREGPGYIGYLRREVKSKRYQSRWLAYNNEGKQISKGTTAEQVATSLFYRTVRGG